MQVLTGDDVMIGGFVVGGSANKTVVVRARGPSLVPFGITNALANPSLQLVRSSDDAILATNDDWQSAGNAAAVTASGFAPSNNLESAVLMSLPPGAYTAIVSGVAGATGVAIVEVFEVDGPAIPLSNISTRGRVLTGNDVMIGGFMVQGSEPQTVIVRARGPSLVPFGIPNALANPDLTLVRSSDNATLATNDDWEAAVNPGAISASGKAPSHPLESAILMTLAPGAYTAIVSGVGGSTGVGIVEAFAITMPADTVPPRVFTTSPLHTALHMSVLVPITVTFTEPMDPATITPDTFTLVGPTGAVAGTRSVSGNTATLTPNARLLTETVYTGTITTEAKDLAGIPLLSYAPFQFTTRVDEPPPIVAGCPTPPSTSQLRRLEWGAPLILKRNSGEVTSFRVAQSESHASVAYTQGQMAQSPPSPTIDLTVSRCPGVIEENLHPSCWFTTKFYNFARIAAFNRPLTEFGWTTQEQHAAVGCLAPNTEQHYVNVRWTFSSCPFGIEGCGFSLQWGEGAY